MHRLLTAMAGRAGLRPHAHLRTTQAPSSASDGAGPWATSPTADVAAMTMPAVVNINTDKVVEMQNHPFMDDPIFRRFFDRRCPTASA